MWKTMTIHADDDKVEVTMFFNETENRWDEAQLQFNELTIPGWPKVNLCWDNTSFLFNHLLPFLYRWENRTCTDEDKSYTKIILEEDGVDIWKYFEDNPKIVEGLIEILEESKKISNYGESLL